MLRSAFRGRMLAEVEKLIDKGEHRTAEEDAALDLMVRLIKDYEEERHPPADPRPHEMLVYLMEQRGLRQADLLPIFKSRGYVSDVVNGKRVISKVHAKQLAEFFKVSANFGNEAGRDFAGPLAHGGIHFSPRVSPRSKGS